MDYQINITYHTTEQRFNKRRDFGLPEYYILKIIEESIKQGITAYRNRGYVVVLTKSISRYYSLLVSVENENITVITIFSSKNRTDKAFITVKNRINLIQFYNLPDNIEVLYALEHAKTLENVTNDKLKGLKIKKKARKKYNIPKISQEEIDMFISSIKK